MEVKVSTSVNMMLNRNIPVQLVSNSLYMILNTKTGNVCQPVQKKWSLKNRVWLLIITQITQFNTYYSKTQLLLKSTSITQDHPGANQLTCQRRQPLPDSGPVSGPLLNISLQSSPCWSNSINKPIWSGKDLRNALYYLIPLLQAQYYTSISMNE